MHHLAYYEQLFKNLMTEFYSCECYISDDQKHQKYKRLDVYYKVKCANRDDCRCRECEQCTYSNTYANYNRFSVLHDKIIAISELLDAKNVMSTQNNDYHNQLKAERFIKHLEDFITFDIKHRNNVSEIKCIEITIAKM